MVGDRLMNPAHLDLKRCIATVTESLMHRSVSVIANHDAVAEEVYLTFSTDRSGKIPKRVTLDSDMCEAVCYPMFFPYAESGWSTTYSDILGFQDYMCCRILMPELNLYDPFEYGPEGLILAVPNKTMTRTLNTNRFQLLARLKSYYMVEQFSR